MPGHRHAPGQTCPDLPGDRGSQTGRAKVSPLPLPPRPVLGPRLCESLPHGPHEATGVRRLCSSAGARVLCGPLLHPARPRGPPGCVLGVNRIPVGEAKDRHVPLPVPEEAP